MSRLWQLMSQVYSYVKSLVRTKEVSFWVVVFPLVMLVILTLVFANPDDITVDVGILDETEDMIFTEILAEVKSVNLREAGDVDTLIEMLRNGSVDAVLYASGSFEKGLTTKIYYLEGVDQSELAARVLEGVLMGIEDGIRRELFRIAQPFIPGNASGFLELFMDPVNATVEPIQPEIVLTRGAFVLNMVTRMVGVQILFIGLFSGSMMVIAKKQQKILRLILSSPIDDITLLISDTLGAFVAIIVSTISILLGGVVLGADYSLMTLEKLVMLVVIGIVGSLFMTGLGLILSLIPKTIEGANALVNMIAFPIMFLGGIIVPIHFLPEFVRGFAEAFPVSRLINRMINILIYKIPVEQMLIDVAIVGVSAIIIYGFGILVYRRLMERAVENP